MKAGELESLFGQRTGNKCILFARPQTAVKISEDEIVVTANASRKYMKVSVVKRASVTDPEKTIRDLRRLKRKITIEEKTFYKEDYQIRMLKANNPEGLLKMGGRGMNNSSYYDYDVSGKISMKAMFERSKISSEDIKMFLQDLKITVKEVETILS